MVEAMTVFSDGFGGLLFDLLTWAGGVWLGIKAGFLVVGFVEGMPIWVGTLWACAGIMLLRSLFWVASRGVQSVLKPKEDIRTPKETDLPPVE